MNVSIFFILLMFMCVGVFLVIFFYGVFVFSFIEWYFIVVKLNFYSNSVFFSCVLFIVTLSVIVFSSYYMDGELNLVYFMLVLMVFVCSMFFLCFSSGVFSMLVSWDVLGVSSFFLVLFYNNWDSCSGAMNTVLTNRVGDFFLFLFFCFFMYSGLSFWFLTYIVFVIICILVLSGFTKSAQFPFSGWLPKAMSAPTPVSALVHSSTLVTAGLILIMNFNILVLDYMVSCLLLLGGLFTMVFSSICALLEPDMKKVVALSTLSQMGFSMMTLGMGLYFVSLLHLVSHALFKSCLFMQVGFYIHSMFSQQDARGYGCLGESLYFVQLQMMVTLFCLCGLFFVSGSVTKDLILEFFFFESYSIVLSAVFFVGVFLTFGYSCRLFLSLYRGFNHSLFFCVGSVMVGVFSFFLVLLSIVGMWWMSNNILLIPVVFVYVDMYVPLLYVCLLVLMLGFVLMFFIVEFKYKFLVDYDAKQFNFMIVDDKFFDVSINFSLNSVMGAFSYAGFIISLVFKNLGINMMVVVFFILFMLL